MDFIFAYFGHKLNQKSCAMQNTKTDHDTQPKQKSVHLWKDGLIAKPNLKTLS